MQQSNILFIVPIEKKTRTQVWRNGSWHKDPFLKVVSGEGGGGIEESITAIASSSTTSMADSASYYARLATNVAGAAAV
jgi:hypothetical protein